MYKSAVASRSNGDLTAASGAATDTARRREQKERGERLHAFFIFFFRIERLLGSGGSGLGLLGSGRPCDSCNVLALKTVLLISFANKLS